MKSYIDLKFESKMQTNKNELYFIIELNGNKYGTCIVNYLLKEITANIQAGSYYVTLKSN